MLIWRECSLKCINILVWGYNLFTHQDFRSFTPQNPWSKVLNIISMNILEVCVNCGTFMECVWIYQSMQNANIPHSKVLKDYAVKDFVESHGHRHHLWCLMSTMAYTKLPIMSHFIGHDHISINVMYQFSWNSCVQYCESTSVIFVMNK